MAHAREKQTFSLKFQATVLESWDDIHFYARHGWIYRGQRCANWEMQTSFQRCCDRNAIRTEDRARVERDLFREFRRAYYNYSRHLPGTQNVLEWLSLMQHHGAPTRLLDFTYSIYVAAYFALEAADNDCAIWAVNGPWALSRSLAALRDAGKSNVDFLGRPFQEDDERHLEEIFFEDPFALCACALNPFRLHERLRIQKGVFLVPMDSTRPFMDNLCAIPGHDSPKNLVKLVIPKSVRDQAMPKLFEMNISRASLFPNLDGYAQSLSVYHPIYHPINWRSEIEA